MNDKQFKRKVIGLSIIILAVFSVKVWIDLPPVIASYNKWQDSKHKLDSLTQLRDSYIDSLQKSTK